jgi:hypothetical protein
MFLSIFFHAFCENTGNIQYIFVTNFEDSFLVSSMPPEITRKILKNTAKIEVTELDNNAEKKIPFVVIKKKFYTPNLIVEYIEKNNFSEKQVFIVFHLNLSDPFSVFIIEYSVFKQYYWTGNHSFSSPSVSLLN